MGDKSSTNSAFLFAWHTALIKKIEDALNHRSRIGSSLPTELDDLKQHC